MSDNILDQASQIAQCRECPWYRACAVPIRFTPEDIRRQIEASPSMNPGQQIDSGAQNLLANMAAAAQNSMVEACPVFIARLRSNPKLAERIKKVMQNWSDEG